MGTTKGILLVVLILIATVVIFFAIFIPLRRHLIKRIGKTATEARKAMKDRIQELERLLGQGQQGHCQVAEAHSQAYIPSLAREKKKDQEAGRKLSEKKYSLSYHGAAERSWRYLVYFWDQELCLVPLGRGLKGLMGFTVFKDGIRFLQAGDFNRIELPSERSALCQLADGKVFPLELPGRQGIFEDQQERAAAFMAFLEKLKENKGDLCQED